MNLSSWFEGDNLSNNLRTVISRVMVFQEPEMNNSDCKFFFFFNRVESIQATICD